jgi:hypothetical protein
MKKTFRFAPPNSMVVVMDQTGGDIPATFGGTLVAFTDSCVAIATLAAIDGETTIVLADEMPTAFAGSPAFDGVLETPSKGISLHSALDQRLLDFAVADVRTRVRVWANDPSAPDEIYVVLTAP